MNHEFPDVQAGFRKGRGTRDQIANNHWIFEKAKKVPEKHLLLLYWLCQSLWLCGSQQTGKFLKRWEYQTTLPSSWEICMHVKKQQIESEMKQQTDCFQIREGVHQSCILSPCLFNFYAEYIMQNARLDEMLTGIKTDRRNINNIRYADDIHPHTRVKTYIQKNTYFCFIDYTKAFDSVDHKKLAHSLRDGNTRPPYLPPEKSVCRSKSNS